MSQTADSLLAALNAISHVGSFCVSGCLPDPLPGLEVAGLGPVGLPLNADTAGKLIASCRQAPYGQGELTLVDTRVRRVWQLNPDRFALTNPAWTDYVAEVAKTVQRELGLENQKLECDLYNLLVYEAGGFFLPHRDGEKRDRMVATLVVALPTAFTGGELVVRHDGQERIVDLGPDSAFETQFAAFYADCEHEIRPLTSGHRLCLVYNLVLAKAQKSITAPRTSKHVEEVARVLRGWTDDDASPRKLVVPLEHQYTADGLTWDTLKGADRTRAAVLHQAADNADCRAYLALLTFSESAAVEEVYGSYSRSRRRGHQRDSEANGEYEIVEVLDSNLTLAHWSDALGGRPAFGEMAVEEDEIVPPDSLARVVPQQDVSGYTGNEGLTMNRWYRHAALVVWPRAHEFEVLCDCGSTVAIAELQRLVGNGKSNRESGIAFARAILVHCATSCSREDGDRLLTSLVKLDDAELVRAFLRQVLAKNGSVQPGEEILAVFDRHGWSGYKDALFDAFRTTTSETLARNVAFLVMLCEAKQEGTDASRLKVCGELAEVAVSRIEAIDRAAVRAYDWHLSDVKRTTVLVSLCKAFVAISRDRTLWRLIRHALSNGRNFPLSAHVRALTELDPWLRTRLKSRSVAVSRWDAEVRGKLETLTGLEPQAPKDFPRAANVPCECEQCREFKRFLLDRTEEVHRFRALQERRKHLEAVIHHAGFDVDCQTERIGSPHVLVCTKNAASFERRLAEYRDDCRNLETIREIEGSLPK